LQRRRTGPSLIRLARTRGWRQAVASLALVFFSLQSFLTQTHIHLLWQGTRGASAQTLASGFGARPAPAQNHLPPADSPATCPICQDMLLAGHFTAPGAIALAMPQQIAAFIAIAAATPVYLAAISHHWRGRAPPTH